MGYIIFFILLQSRFAVAAEAEYKITPVPAQRFQGNIGACGSFAVATVLDHLLCQKKPELCKTSVVNTLDIMRTSAEDYDGVTYPSDIIKNLSEKSLYVETCRPYESFKGPMYPSDKYTVTVNSTGEKRTLMPHEYDILAGQFWISEDYVMQKSIEYDRVGGYCKNPDKTLCSIALTYVN